MIFHFAMKTLYSLKMKSKLMISDIQLMIIPQLIWKKFYMGENME